MKSISFCFPISFIKCEGNRKMVMESVAKHFASRLPQTQARDWREKNTSPKIQTNINKMLKYVLCIENGVWVCVCICTGEIRMTFSVVGSSVCSKRNKASDSVWAMWGTVANMRCWENWCACDRLEPQNLINNFTAGMYYSCHGMLGFTASPWSSGFTILAHHVIIEFER